MLKKNTIAVVIPCFKVKDKISDVVKTIPDFVDFIYVVDDACPDGSGLFVLGNSKDKRIKLIKHTSNLGVGAAVISGYKAAIKDKAHIIIKMDGDGQMNPSLIQPLIDPIINGEADYTKGNRFYDLELVKRMPIIRLIGNSILSFMTKLSSGYWHIFDPTNGYTAINSNLIRILPLQKISRRYFFETDMLFRLNISRAVVQDIPMLAIYEDEVSNLSIIKIIPEFAYKHFRNIFKRIFYSYYLRGMSIASLELPLGLLLMIFGISYGFDRWHLYDSIGLNTPAGIVMLSALPILSGLQLLLNFLNYDFISTPSKPISKNFKNYKKYN